MKFIETLASYIPAIIVNELLEQMESGIKTAPYRITMDTVCMFCDVSGFTKLAEAMAKSGMGAEGLAKYLNQYFSLMCREIQAQGGDIFKYAGDAMIVLWPPDEDDSIENRIRRAAQAAIAIQTKQHAMDLHEGVQLSVKIGLGVGEVAVLFLGGVFGRMESVAVGDPLIQAFESEHHGASGQVIASKEVWKYLSKHYGFLREKKYMTEIDDGFVLVHCSDWDTFDALTSAKKMITKRSTQMPDLDDSEPVLLQTIQCYVPGSVTAHLDESNDEEKWHNAVRKVATLFVNLGTDDKMLIDAATNDEVLEEVNKVLNGVQTAVYRFEGAINKFLLDDKGSTLIACFGLPPNAHEDDAVRAVLAGLAVCESLLNLGYRASVGITFGDVFCGVVGARGRREYSILGDPVNLSARLMQAACVESGGVIVDQCVRDACGDSLAFTPRGSIQVKGKVDAINIFHPYPPAASFPGINGQNPVDSMPLPQDSGTFSAVGSKYIKAKVGGGDGSGNQYRKFGHKQLEILAAMRQATSLQGYFAATSSINDCTRPWAPNVASSESNGEVVSYRARSMACGVAAPKTAAERANTKQRILNRIASRPGDMKKQGSSLVPGSGSFSEEPSRRRSMSTDEFEEGGISAGPKPSNSVDIPKAARGSFHPGQNTKSFLVSNSSAPLYTEDSTVNGDGSFAYIARCPPLRLLNGLIPIGPISSDILNPPPPPVAATSPRLPAKGDDRKSSASLLLFPAVSTGGNHLQDVAKRGSVPARPTAPPPAGRPSLLPSGVKPVPPIFVLLKLEPELLGTSINNGELPTAMFRTVLESAAGAGEECSVAMVDNTPRPGITPARAVEEFVGSFVVRTVGDLVRRAVSEAVMKGASISLSTRNRGKSTATFSGDGVKVSEAGTGAPFHAAAAKARETKAIALSGLQENSDDEAEGGESSIQDEAERLAEQCAAAIRKHTLECAAMLRDVVLVVTSTRLVLPFDGPGGSLPASYISAFVSEGIRCRSAMPDILDLSAKIERNGSSSHCPFRLSLVQRSSLTAVSSRMIIARSALLVAKCRLLESHRKISFHKNNNTTAESEDGVTTVPRQGLGTGSLILIEGQPGVGKSHLVSSSLVDVLPGRTLNYHVAASPLPPPSGSKRNCQRAAPLVMVLLQYLSKRHGKNVGTVGDVVGRTALLLAELREMDSEASKEGSSSPFSALSLMSHAHLLNDSFGTQCDAPVSDADDEFMLDDSEENLKVCELIMLHLFKRLSEWKPSMVIIEDAHYLDEATWSLCAAITTGSVGPHPPPLSSSPTIFNLNSLPLAIVFVSRPPEFRGLYQKNAASAAVVKQHSTVISLDGLPPEVMEGVLIRQLGHGVKGLTADLYVLVERCSLGNPRIAIEFLVNLRESGMLAFKRVHSQTASSSSMRESFDMSPGRLSNSSSANEEMGGLSVTAGFSDSYIADLSAYFRGQLSKETGDGARYLASTLATKHNLIPMQACRYLGAVVDRLTSAQSLLLTTAAILVADIHKILGVNASNTTVRTCRAHHLLGKPELDGSASGGCFPAKANYEKLANELLELIGLGILVDLSLENDKTPVPQGATKTQFAMSKLVIGFAFPFHVEYLLGGILVEHIRSVEKQMQKHEDAAARVTRKKMASAVMPTMSVGTDAPLLQGDLKVKKHEITATDSASILRAASRFAFVSKKNNGKGEGDWKHRYLCLDSRKLTIYYTKAAYQKASASIGPPKDAVQVELGSLLTTNFESASGSKDNTVTVEMEPYSTFDNANVFTLTSQSSSKNGKVRESTRTWYIEAESEAKAKEWVYMIRYVVEVAEAENKRAKWLSVVQTPEMSKRARKNFTKLKIRFAFLRSFMKMWRYDEWGFARLVVSVEEARGVINPHNLGVPLCYVRMSIVRTDATTQSTDSATPMEQRNRRMSRLSIHQGVTSQEEAMSTQYMTPVAHPPSSSPSWKSLGPRGGCPIFIFDNMDALTANPMKGRRRGNTGTRRKFDENDFIENMESFALKIEVCSAEQLVANEVLATALVLLGDVDTLDISDESDKSETKIEKIIETTSFRWWKLKTSPGIQSSFLDKSMVAHAAIRVGVKLVYSMPPSIRPSSCSNASNVSQTSHDSADENVEENEVDVDADPQVATETETVTPDTTVAEAEEEETQKEEQEVEEPEVDLEMYKKDDDDDGEGTGFDDLYVAPGASEVLSADDVPNSPEVDAKKGAARHSALSSGGEDIVSFNNPMFRPSSNSN